MAPSFIVNLGICHRSCQILVAFINAQAIAGKVSVSVHLHFAVDGFYRELFS